MTLKDLGARLARPDWLQLAALLFAALLFAWWVAAPTRPERANDGWYAVSQVRLVGLSLLALGYGSFLAQDARREQRATLAALVALALLSSPLEVLAYALSYPAQPLLYALGLGVLDSVAMFGLGLLLGRVFRWLHLWLLLPLVGPAAFVGLVYLDALFGVNLGNPLAALGSVSKSHLGFMGCVAALTLWRLSRPEAREELR